MIFPEDNFQLEIFHFRIKIIYYCSADKLGLKVMTGIRVAPDNEAELFLVQTICRYISTAENRGIFDNLHSQCKNDAKPYSHEAFHKSYGNL